MPSVVLTCALCGRDRKWSKLDLEFNVDDQGNVRPYHKCKNDCLPTWWEARRERKQNEKLLSDLKRWTQNP